MAKRSRSFVGKVEKIYQALQEEEHYSEIREKIDQAMRTDVYQAMKKMPVAAVEFLQVLSIKYNSVDCRDAIRAYGAQCTKGRCGDIHGKFSWRHLANILDEEVDGYAFKRNKGWQNGIWAISHARSMVFKFSVGKDPD